MNYGYLVDLALILLATKALSMLTGKLQMPQVVGALVAGLLMGPAVLGIIQPSDFLSQVAELGVIVIMFSAGMGTDLNELKQTGKAGFVIAMAGVLVPLAMGTGLMFVFNTGELALPGNKLLQDIFLGVVLTATSVSITVETLKELGKLSTRVGNAILAAALIDDVLGLVCLTIVTSLAGADVNILLVLAKILLFFVFVGLLGVGISRLLNWYETKVRSRDLRRYPVLAFVLCLFLAWAAEEWFGVADIIGAFSAGLIVATTPKGAYTASKFTPVSYLLLTPVFFANLGLGVELPRMDATILLFTVTLVIVGIGSKLIGCGLGAKMFGFKNRQCLQVGCGMACRGEVALIVANKGMAMNMINPVFFGPIIILVVCCAVFTPILLKLAFKGESAYEGMEESRLAEGFQLSEQVDEVTARLIEGEKRRQGK
ncbi:MAG TPA: cation:proton antiporter [Candidatus Fournierella merdigallinarum]|nr:cation:proton antiporter [Candidatus Fournierella merdigallinarum]